MSAAGRANLARLLVWASVLTGLVLIGIGVRFLADPERAATFFGIDKRNPAFAAHSAIALRDIWLGLLLIALAWLRHWPGVAIWFGLGVLVCLGDAAIASGSSGRVVSIGFHVVSGAFCALAGWLAWRLSQKA